MESTATLGASAPKLPATPHQPVATASGCEHYSRRCRLVTPCCDRAYWCRHCHNAEQHDDNPDPKTRHVLDRSQVTEVICAGCDLRQPVAPECSSCGLNFGAYYCATCRMFDDDTSKLQFHCDDCGICRVGGRDQFFHCDTCGCCFSTAIRDDHTCIERNMHANCPVCLEYLFESRAPIAVLSCGHTMHHACMQQLTGEGLYACPTCERSFLDMSGAWEKLDAEVAAVQMPEEYRNLVVRILCKDCGERSDVAFHVAGLKCQSTSCGSYNTARL